MAIGNLSLKIRQMPSLHRIIMVTLLPIRIINNNITLNRQDEKQRRICEVLNEVLQHVLKHSNLEQNPSTESSYYNDLVQMVTSGIANWF